MADPSRYDGSRPEPAYDTFLPPMHESELDALLIAECERCAKIVESYRWDEVHNECCEGNMGWLLGKVAEAVRNR